MSSNDNKFLQLFEDISKGVSKYITLDALQIGTPYEVIQFRLHDSAYGRCLIVDLVDGFWLVLPKRIGDMVKTNEQLSLLNSKKYKMTFKGRHEQYRKMAIIEFTNGEQMLKDQVNYGTQPIPNFEIGIDGIIQSLANQIEAEIPSNETVTVAAAPKMTIKIKKDKK